MTICTLLIGGLFFLIAAGLINSYPILVVTLAVVGLIQYPQTMIFIHMQKFQEASSVSLSIALVCVIMNVICAFGQPLFGFLLEMNSGSLAIETLSAEDCSLAFLIIPVSFLLSLALLPAICRKSKPEKNGSARKIIYASD